MKWYQSKTLWFAVLWIVVQVANIFGYAEYAPAPDLVYYVNIGIAVLVGVLRLVTKEKIEL